ncbi:MAG: PD40 domain-containing protein [Gemmatimonadota bacterium]|nr:MAG: PD40 domain-containing protein [Gemmatimonadota bacterium]
MKKTTVVLPLTAAVWLTATGCTPPDRGEGVQTAGFVSGAQLGAGVAGADPQGTQGVATRRILAGLEDTPMGSPSPDGGHLTDVDWNTGDLAIRDLKTGEWRHITHEGSWTSMEWAEGSRVSPDGRSVAYTWYEPSAPMPEGLSAGIRVIPVEGGESRVLVSNEGNRHAQPFDWSADGTQVLVRLTRSDGTNQIGLVDVADAELHIVKSLGGAPPANMALSRDGRYVAYDIQREASSPNHAVHIVAADGSRDREVTGRGGHNIVLGWEPSGRYLLYYGDGSGSPSVWALQTTEGRPQGEPLLIRSDLWHLIPMGFTAAGDYFYGVTTGKVDMFTVLTDPETGAPIGEPQSVTPHYQAGTALYPRWSPDGRYLAYRRTPPSGGGMRHSMVIRAVESGEFREIGLDLGIVLSPDWSSDGRFLVVWGRKGRTGGTDLEGIYRIDVQTGEHGFAHTIEGEMRGVAWLDDGRTVIYKEVRSGEGARECRFVTLDLSSGQEREIYRWSGLSMDWWWTLSPDRRTIAGVFGPAENPGENPWTLRLVSLSDGASRDLAQFKPWVADDAVGPSMWPELFWTPDSRSFHFRGCISPDQVIEAPNRCPNWSFDVETGAWQRLADNAPLGSIHPDGRRVAFADGETSYEIWVMQDYLPDETSDSGTRD